MHRKGTAKAAFTDLPGQDRIVCGVEDAGSRPGEQHQKHQLPVSRDEAYEANCKGIHEKAANEDRAAPEAIDQEAHRRLEKAHGHGKGRQGEAQFYIAHAKFATDRRKQGWQGQHIEMTEEMGERNDARDMIFPSQNASRRRQDRGVRGNRCVGQLRSSDDMWCGFSLALDQAPGHVAYGSCRAADLWVTQEHSG